MVLSGEAQCSRQIVTVSNSDGKIVECDNTDKPQYNMVRSASWKLNFVFTNGVQSVFSHANFVFC